MFSQIGEPVVDQRHNDQAILTSTLDIHNKLGVLTERLGTVLDDGKETTKFLFGNGHKGFVEDMREKIAELKNWQVAHDAGKLSEETLERKRFVNLGIFLSLLTIVVNLVIKYWK